MAKLTGQLRQSPLIQNNTTTINNTLSLQQNAEFDQLQADLLRVLERHPEALRDVVREFNRLES
jgi:hypothetical protein